MSKLDQCPTSKKQGLPVDKAASSRERSQATGKSYWRSLDDLAQTPEFKDFLHREFPANASELLSGSRRDFLKIMGASVALAGAAAMPGCRRPDHKIIAYNRKPEEVIHGKPLFYATSRRRPGGGVDLLLAETFEGRPTKLEGNPLDHASGGALTMHAQASVLDLYDPDRSPEIVAAMAESRGTPFTVRPWGDFTAFAGTHFGQFDETRGRGLSFLVEKVSSPSRDRMREAIRTRWPEAKWLPYSPLDDEASIAGTSLAFGAPKHVGYDLGRADIIVSLDCDLLGSESTLEGLRGFGRNRIREGRDGREARDTRMSRIYAVDSRMSLTGGQADHRLSAHVDAVGAVAIALAEAVLEHTDLRSQMRSAGDQLRSALASAKAAADVEAVPGADEWARWAADDLVRNRGRSVVVPGRSQPAAVHALAAALNHLLDNDTATVLYRPMHRDLQASSVESVRSVVEDARAGTLQTLVTIGANPVFTAPADLNFREAVQQVPVRIHLGDADETAEASTWFLGRTHFLEEWNDAEAADGTRAICQPMLKPLYDYHSDIELLAAVLGDRRPDGYAIVRDTLEQTLQPRLGNSFRRALHDGIVPESRDTVEADPVVAPRWDRIATALRDAAASFRPDPERIDVLMLPDDHVLSGEMANNGWLQELPGAVTKVSWSNPAVMSLATAKKLRLRTGRKLVKPQYSHTEVVEIEHEGRTVRCPIWIMPGVADNQIIVSFGQGRRVCGRIGEGTGYDMYPLRTTGSMVVARGVAARRARGVRPELVPNTQDHWVMEGRDIVRAVDLEAWRRHGDMALMSEGEIARLRKDPYGNKREIEDVKFANRLGIESHTPVNRDSYRESQMHGYNETIEEDSGELKVQRDGRGRVVGILTEHGKRVQQWGMSIDLTTCIGCGACTVACQAENNIPIVGPKEVAKGREMHWIRIDRYFGSGRENPLGDPNPEFFTMPVTCVHCENAPCEVVCPVNATVHGPEGTNNMAYNRCVGTRYCSNNCPYKVRRFNYFDYGTKQFRGGFGQLGEPLDGLPANTPDALKPAGENFIPPRLREKKIEVSTLQYNPHVTVRSRGLMEKCTYCIQRINAARIETKLHDLAIIPDGYFTVACAQACPTGAIVFGDIYDYSQYRDSDGSTREGSLVSIKRNSQRSYALLAFLNTRPRGTHQIRVHNPNPDWIAERASRGDTDAVSRMQRWNDPFHHADHDDHHQDDHITDHGSGHAKAKRFSLPILDANGVEIA